MECNELLMNLEVQNFVRSGIQNIKNNRYRSIREFVQVQDSQIQCIIQGSLITVLYFRKTQYNAFHLDLSDGVDIWSKCGDFRVIMYKENKKLEAYCNNIYLPVLLLNEDDSDAELLLNLSLQTGFHIFEGSTEFIINSVQAYHALKRIYDEEMRKS